MARKGGSRRKRVKVLTKNSRQKGKISLRRYLSTYNSGDRVSLSMEPAVHEGFFHPRFSGKTGTVVGKKGSCYEVKIKDINKEKIILVHPVHLKRVE